MQSTVARMWGLACTPLFLLLPACSSPHLDSFASDDIDSYMISMETTVGSSEGSLPPDLQRPCSPHSPEEEEDEDVESNTVPGTPPTKKVGQEQALAGRQGQTHMLGAHCPVFVVPLAVLWIRPGPHTVPAEPRPSAGRRQRGRRLSQNCRTSRPGPENLHWQC